MEIIAGLIATVTVIALGYATRQGRSLQFYSSVLVVIGLVYVLFAAMAGATRIIGIESMVAAVFVTFAVMAARWGTVRGAGLLLAAGLALHGAYDLVHPAVVANPAVPGWWPPFCAVADLLLAGWMVVLVIRGALVVPLEN